MRLLIVTQKIDENDSILGFFVEWVKEFAKSCEQVTVICLFKGAYDLPENVKVLSLGKECGNFQLFSKFKYLFNFYKYIWQEQKRYDAVFVHMNPEYIVLGGLVWKLLKAKVALWYTHKAVNLKLKIAEKLTDIVFTASVESFRLKSKKVNVVGHGININQFPAKVSYDVNNNLQIISVGRISPVKDYETLINAAAILKKDNLKFNIQIIGGPISSEDERYLAKLKNLVRENNLEKEINFLGSAPHKDIAKYLNQADLFVHMSQTGSLDKVVLEAMASGLLVVSSNDASRELLKDYREILFFQAREETDLANKIKGIMTLDVEKINQISRSLREMVGHDHSLHNLITTIRRKIS